MTTADRPRALVLARNYPNNVIPTMGLWTRRLVEASAESVDPVVVAPVPFAPPLLPIEAFSRFRRVVAHERGQGFDVHHPRVPYPPGYALHRFEASLIWPRIRAVADRLHEARPFRLIHAHFIFPDGVLAARLGKRYGIPVVCTEGAPWRPWFDDYGGVREQVFAALDGIRHVLPVSTWLERNIREVAGDRARTRVVPNVVDDRLFHPDAGVARDPDQALFVGVIRRVKGLDVLVRALALLRDRLPSLRLLVVGGAIYRSYQRDEDEVRRLVAELGLQDRIRFAGQSEPAQVVAAMRSSAFLVVPSRRETFSSVTAEAVACGIPVVATRCGGPEDIVTPGNGLLVPNEDPEALAEAIAAMRARSGDYDPRVLHDDVVSRFGARAAAGRLRALYGELLG